MDGPKNQAGQRARFLLIPPLTLESCCQMPRYAVEGLVVWERELLAGQRCCVDIKLLQYVLMEASQ